MSEINKVTELSTDELDTVAGGAFSAANVSNVNKNDEQASLLNNGADGGIQSIQTQKTTESVQELQEIKFTGDVFGGGSFGA